MIEEIKILPSDQEDIMEIKQVINEILRTLNLFHEIINRNYKKGGKKK